MHVISATKSGCKIEKKDEDEKSKFMRIGNKVTLSCGLVVTYVFRTGTYSIQRPGKKRESYSRRKLEERFSPTVVQLIDDGLSMVDE